MAGSPLQLQHPAVDQTCTGHSRLESNDAANAFQISLRCEAKVPLVDREQGQLQLRGATVLCDERETGMGAPDAPDKADGIWIRETRRH